MTKTIESEAVTTSEATEGQDIAVRGEELQPAGVVLNAIVTLAKDSTVDVAKLQALLAMQERMEDRQAERAFAKALSIVQAELQQVERDGTVDLGGGKGSYAFARMEDIDRVLRPIYSRHGFSISFDRTPREKEGGGVVVTGTLSHEAGHSRTASFSVPLDSGPGRSNIQAHGSSDTYAKRYIIEGFFNIVRKGKDDDGVAAGGQPITFDEAAQIKQLVDEAGIGDGLEGDERKTVIVEWFNDMLGYALPKGYVSIRQEDGVRVRRALLSLKAKRLTSRQKEVQI